MKTTATASEEKRALLANVAARDRRLAETLAHLAPEHLIHILANASAHARSAVIEHSHLGARWKRRRLQPIDNALGAIVVDVQRQMPARSGRPPFIASRLLESWWGRCALRHFGSTSLPISLDSIRMEMRLWRVMRFLKQGDPATQESIRQRAGELKGSSALLDRLFAQLLLDDDTSSEEATADSQAQHVTALPMLAGAGAIEATAMGAPSTPEEQEAHLDLNANNGSPSATSMPTQEQEAGVTPQAPQASPVDRGPSEPAPAASSSPPLEAAHASPGGAGAAPSQPPSDSLARLHGALARYRETKSSCASLLEHGRHEALAAAALIAAQARHHVLARLADIEHELAPYDLRLPAFQESQIATEADVQDTVDQVAALLREATAIEARRLEKEVARFRAEFDGLGLDPPPELTAITSREALAQFSAAWSELLVEERAFREVLSEPEATPRALGAIPPHSRLRVYSRIASVRASRAQAAALRCLCLDEPAVAAAPTAALQLSCQLAGLLLDEGVPVPLEAWQTIARLSPGDVVDTLANTGLLDRVGRAPELLVNDTELQQILSTHRVRLPAGLRRALERLEMATLPPEQQVRRLAALALEPDADDWNLEALVNQLVQAGQFREALLLAVLLVRLGRTIAPTGPVKRALLLVLIESAADRASVDIARVLIDDGLWLTHSNDDLVVLLYLAARTGTREWYDMARYTRQAAFESASLIRPALVHHLESEILTDSQPEEHTARRDQLAQARQALADWDHDIQKRSCYSGWDFYATKYQVVFRARLTEAMSRIEDRQPVQLLSAEELLKEASQGLPVVEGDGRKAMLQYLEKQIDRLKVISGVIQYIDRGSTLREALGAIGRRARETLSQEAAHSRENLVLSRVYQRVIEAIDGP
ncbi:hypothetical protein [Sorangium sp. So ce117]|uniref:hypothetical protein n=1 Tax=Sorangium sp. So ce117 TaxID=3133277 RepID=UPI003F611D5B